MILVAGASGTLGRVLVHSLVERGEPVRALTRDPSRIPEPGIEVAVADLRNTAAVERAMSGCEVVVLAAHGFTGSRGASPETIDRDANIAVIDRAAEAGVRHIVLVSAYGASAEHPMSLHRAKYAAELALRASDVRGTIIRATPFLETWDGIIGAHIDDRHEALVFGPGTNPIDFVSVLDVAGAIEEAIDEHSRRERQRDVTGGRTRTFTELAEDAAARSATPVRIRHIPLGMLRMLSHLAGPVSPRFARQAHAAVVMNTTDMTAGSRCAPSAAGRILG